MKKLLFTAIISLATFFTFAQSVNKSEIEQISEVLMHYIEGTANGEPERLQKAFHPDFNLYTVTEQDSLRIRSGKNTLQM